MKVLNILMWASAALLAVVLLTSCMTPDQVANLTPVLADMVKEGTLTQTQMDLILGALQPGFNWKELAEWGGVTALNLILGYFGIKRWRGSPTARKGLAPASNA